jgi:Flp pilus assembly protein TadG
MNLLNKYRCNERGNMTVMAGATILVMMTVVAFAIDYGTAQSQKAKLQDAADAAALSGAVSLGKGGRDIERASKSKAHEFATKGNDTTLRGYRSNVVVDTNTETVSVDLRVEVPQLISGLMTQSALIVSVSAVAKALPGNTSCLYILDPISSGAFSTGGSAELNATNCNVQINSTSPSAMTNSGSADVNADKICVTGGYTGNGYNPTPETNCPSVSDPFVGLAIPAAGTCDHTNFSASTDIVLTPGTYCGGIHISGTTNVSLTPGNYILSEGSLTVSGSGSVTGNEIVFVLGNNASFDVGGTGDVLTTPPTSGALEGYSVVQSSTMPITDSYIAGNGHFSFPGIVYMPATNLDISGAADGNSNTPSYAAIVANQLNISGSGELNITANTGSFSQSSAAAMNTSTARLVH